MSLPKPYYEDGSDANATMRRHKSAPRCVNSRGHDTEGVASMPQELTSLCECGCGETPATGRRFISGHNFRTLVRTEAHNAAIAAAQTRSWATTRKRLPLGTRRKDRHGYVLVKVVVGTGRWDKEHVLVMEEHMGRKLKPGEQVHHINGIKDDNRLENLELCENGAEHQRIEATFRRLVSELMENGSVLYDRETREYRCA